MELKMNMSNIRMWWAWFATIHWVLSCSTSSIFLKPQPSTFPAFLSSDGQRRLSHLFRGSEGALTSPWQIEQSTKHSRGGVRHGAHHLWLTEVRGDVSVWWSHYVGISSSLWCQHGPGMTEHCGDIPPLPPNYYLEIHDVNTVFIHYTWWVLTIDFNLITEGNTMETLDWAHY